MKFLKTIRFDPSDTHVFETAAEPGEWAVAGGIYFSGASEGELKGKIKQAFSNGFLSIESLGFSTFASVTQTDETEVGKLVQELARQFLEQLGAPDKQEAELAARQEIDYIVDICKNVPVNSIFALTRFFDDDNEIREEFRLVDKPSGHAHTKIWEIVE